MKQQLLILDSNEMMRSFLSYYYQKHFETRAVASASAAWSCLDQAYYPDLIIMDIDLSNGDGVGFLKQLKESILFKDIPVVVLSSISKSNKRLECLLAGAADYVTKPFNPKELEVRIHNHLKLLNKVI